MGDLRRPGAVSGVGFIGTGLMGAPMAGRLAAAGTPVTVYNRSQGRVRALQAAGAHAADRVGALGRCEIVISMLPDLPELAELVTGEDGLLAAWQTGTEPAAPLLVVMSSVSPVAVSRFGEQVSRLSGGRVAVIDAPVSGGVAGAEAGTLSIMVGSTKEEFARLAPVLDVLGGTVRLMGPLGAGSLAKGCNQLVVAATAAALGEALVVAERGGLDTGLLLEVLAGGLANSQFLQDKRTKLLASDYSTSGAAKMMLKDLNGLREASGRFGAAGPVTLLLREVFERLVADGLGDDDIIVVREAIGRRMANIAAVDYVE